MGVLSCSVSDLIASLPVEGEGRTPEAGPLHPALQAHPLAHQEVLDAAPGDYTYCGHKRIVSAHCVRIVRVGGLY